MTLELTLDVRSRLDAHLDAVERALVAAGNPRERRRGVVDDLEAQILDMLSAKSATPMVADLDAVLAKLDPPQAYVEAGGKDSLAAAVAVPAVPANLRPHFSRTAIAGFICLAISWLPMSALLVVGVLAHQVQVTAGSREAQDEKRAEAARVQGEALRAAGLGPRAAPRAPAGATTAPAPGRGALLLNGFLALGCFAIPLLMLGLVGTVLGWAAFVQIRRAKGSLRGIGLAIFDGLFYPLAMALGAIVVYL